MLVMHCYTFTQWRNKVAVGPRASIPKGPPLPQKNFLKTASGKFWAPHSAGPACTAHLARPIVTPLRLHLFSNFVYRDIIMSLFSAPVLHILKLASCLQPFGNTDFINQRCQWILTTLQPVIGVWKKEISLLCLLFLWCQHYCIVYIIETCNRGV